MAEHTDRNSFVNRPQRFGDGSTKSGGDQGSSRDDPEQETAGGVLWEGIKAVGEWSGMWSSEFGDDDPNDSVSVGDNDPIRTCPKLRSDACCDRLARFGSDIRDESARMAEHYRMIYCLERYIQDLVVRTLEKAEGVRWFTSDRVPKDIYRQVRRRWERDVQSGVEPRSSRPINYTTLGELGTLIVSNMDVFGTVFPDQQAVSNVIARLNFLRSRIAHCCELGSADAQRLDLAVHDWFRLMVDNSSDTHFGVNFMAERPK